jgi:hypothetical protein
VVGAEFESVSASRLRPFSRTELRRDDIFGLSCAMVPAAREMEELRPGITGPDFAWAPEVLGVLFGLILLRYGRAVSRLGKATRH